MRLVVLILTFTASCTFAKKIPGNDCKMNLDEMTINTPLFRNTKGRELMPDGSDLSIFGLKDGEMVEISCFSSGNKLNRFSTKSVNGTCIAGGKVKTRRGVFPLNTFSCSRPMYPITVYRGSCNGPKRGRFIDVGYKGDNGEFIKGMSICHNKERGETYWAYSVVFPKVYRHRVKHLGIDEEIKIGQVIDIYGSIVRNISEVYTAEATKLAKIPALPQTYVETIVPGFLIPPEDFMSYNMQKISLYYLNTVPQWNSTYNGPWKLIEQMIRKKYRDDSEPITILAGTYGIKTGNRKDQELWLSQGMVPFPKYLWKAIFRDGKSLVFSIENGPSTNKPGTPPTPFAEGFSCARRGWNFGKLSDKITCGTVKKLISVVGQGNLPHNFIYMVESKEKTSKNKHRIY